MPPAERCEPLQAVAGEEQQGCVATVCSSTDSVVQQGTAEKSASTWKKKKNKIDKCLVCMWRDSERAPGPGEVICKQP